MPLVIKFRDVRQAIRIIRALCPEVDDMEAERIRREYNEHRMLRCEADGGDKVVLLTVVKEGDIALTMISGHQESLDTIEAFCQRIGAEYSVE